jgi:hypothetical protein
MFGCWNIWGLNGKIYIYIAVKVWINKYRLTLIGHLKTKIAYSQIGRVDITINPSS